MLKVKDFKIHAGNKYELKVVKVDPAGRRPRRPTGSSPFARRNPALKPHNCLKLNHKLKQPRAYRF
jgi:hypothetical protein